MRDSGTRLKPFRCDCGYASDTASPASGRGRGPQDGDLAVCFGCAAAQVIEGGRLRMMRDDELAALSLDERRELFAIQSRLKRFRAARK